MDETKGSFIRHRYVVCILVSTGLAFVYAMRVNLSVSIISMAGASERKASNAGTCVQSSLKNGTVPDSTEFTWDEDLRSLVLGSFFYGYVSTQMLGGFMSDTLSIKWVFGYGIFMTSAFTIISHWVVRWNVYAFVVLRVLEGVTEGVTIPAVYCLMARWAPANERTTMTTLSLIGTNIGTVITMPATAALSKSALGWPASFYIPGIIGVVWSLIWYICATSQPENHPWISEEERNYIVRNRGVTTSKKRKIPWFSILTSGPVWMFAIIRLCNSVTFYMFLTEMPSFVDSVFGIPIEENGLLNGFFSALYAVGTFASGALSDILIKKEILSKTNVRKLFDCSSLLFAGFLLIAVSQAKCQWTIVSVLLCAACFVSSLTGGGNAAIALDIAPSLAGSVVGFGNMVGNFAAIIATNLVAFTADPNDVRGGWSTAFYYTSIISFFGAFLFAVLGSAEEQEWSNLKRDELEILPKTTREEQKEYRTDC